MRPISKGYAYAKLKSIRESKGIDTSRYMKETAASSVVPQNVIIFINRHEPIEQFYTYNKVFENRRKNPLYKNLVNENASVSEKAIALSSLVTQTMIHNKELISEGRDSDALEFLDIMNTQRILEALSAYAAGYDTLLNESFSMVRDVFKKLYSNNQLG